MGFSQFDNFMGVEVLFQSSYWPLPIFQVWVGSRNLFGLVSWLGLMHVLFFRDKIIGKRIDHNMLWSAKLSGSLQSRKVRLTDVRHMSGFQGADFFGNILNLYQPTQDLRDGLNLNVRSSSLIWWYHSFLSFTIFGFWHKKWVEVRLEFFQIRGNTVSKERKTYLRSLVHWVLWNIQKI